MYKVTINTLEVGEETELQLLKKNFRKKLMTGGAVLALSSLISSNKILELFNQAKEEAFKPGVARLLLVEFANYEHLSPELIHSLSALKIKDIDRALFKRLDLTDKKRQELLERKQIRSLDQDLLQEKLIQSLENDPKVKDAEHKMRRVFLGNIGSESVYQAKRLSLLSLESLPDDLLFLMQRDPDKRIRFAARSYERVHDVDKII